MENKTKLAFGIGLVSVTGLLGSAFAAAISIPNSGAAGQGSGSVTGYNVANVKYTVDTGGSISQVRFNIYKGTGTGSPVGTTGTQVSAQLRTGNNGTVGRNWVSCGMGAAGLATCNVSGTSATTAALAQGVAVVAFDN